MRAGRERAEKLLIANADLHRQITDALIERGSLDAEEINQLQEERQLAA